MKLVILHHHLNRGGVTQVILNHLRSLHTAGQSLFEGIFVFHGGRIDGWTTDSEDALANVELVRVEPIDYDQITSAAAESQLRSVSENLEKFGCNPSNCLLHIHNHSLGKHGAWPNTLSQLAQMGYRMLLQIHDFAEDFRPANYQHQAECLKQSRLEGMAEVYFQGPQVHYAVLNSRDRKTLSGAGIAEERLHWIANPVQPLPAFPERVQARQRLQECFGVMPKEPFVLYPVRGIRRKNVGEMVLWSALCPQPATFGITLEPKNPDELVSFRRWENLSKEWELPCLFNVGGEGKLTFAENLAAADGILTTSVAEGFGMVFLEAWLAGKNLVGRDLPEITTDFKDAGIGYPQLYSQLKIPIDANLFSLADYQERLGELFADVSKSFAIEHPSADLFDRHMAGIQEQGWIDFAAMTNQAQIETIRSVCQKDALRLLVLQHNPRIASALDSDEATTARIEKNKQCVQDHFGATQTGERLVRIYNQLATEEAAEIQPLASAETILNRFVDLTRLHPVRLETT